MAKILYIWKSPFPWDVRVEKICSALAERHTVLLAARWGGESKKEIEHKNFSVTRIGYSEKQDSIKQKLLIPVEWNPLWKNGLSENIDDFKPDIVIHREMFLTEIVVGLKNKHGFKLIADIAEHYPFLIEYWEHYNPILKFLAVKFDYYYKLEEKLIRNADHVWTVVEENSDRLRKFNSNITEIYNSSNPLNLQKIESDTIRFAYHGFVNKERNLEVFVTIFSEFAKQRKDVALDIYGDGPTFPDLVQLLNSLNTDSIKLHGTYQFDELPNFLANCDVGILPYNRNLQYDHTLSNKFLDYGLNSIIILSSDNPPMKRLVEKYDLGYVYEAENTKSLMESLEKAYLMAKNSLSGESTKFISDGYDWQNQAKKMFDTVDQLMGR